MNPFGRNVWIGNRTKCVMKCIFETNIHTHSMLLMQMNGETFTPINLLWMNVLFKAFAKETNFSISHKLDHECVVALQGTSEAIWCGWEEGAFIFVVVCVCDLIEI